MSDLEADSAATTHLLEQIEAGDADAFGKLLARHENALRSFVSLRLDRRVQSRLDPSDVVQETELEVHRRLKDFLDRRPMPFRVWLRKTAYERLLNLRRHHVASARRSVERDVSLPANSALMLARPFLDQASSPSRALARKDLMRRVQQALTALSETDREVLLMRHVEELPYSTVARILDTEPAAARKRYGRALLRLRAVLVEAGLFEEDA
jgi:RNA polymerase sigma-70 factor (ECF subfamily)